MLPIFVILGVLMAATGVAYAVACRHENRPDRILSLIYHRIVTDEQYAHCPGTEKIFSITEGRFREQMEYLKREGYHAVTLDDVVRYLQGGSALPPKPVSVTFDDGCYSVHEKALPILRELELPAALFVTTDPEAWVFKLGSNAQRMVTPEEMRELDAGGVSIEAHGVTHGAMESMTEEEITFELGECKRYLEEVLGREVRHFGVPLNWYGPKVRAVAEAVGYKAVWTADNGTIYKGSDLFHLRRFIIEGSFTLEEFARNLEPGSIVQRRIINLIKRIPARLLGPRIWLPLRRRLFESFLGRYFALRQLKRIAASGFVVLVLAALFVVWWMIGS